MGYGGNDEDSNSVEFKLSKNPKIEEKSEKVLSSLAETKTPLTYKNSSSNTNNIIALHYETVNNGSIIFQYYISIAELNGISIIMEKNEAEASGDYLALVSTTTSNMEFEFDNDMYEQLGDVVQNFKTTTINDLTVSMIV